MCFIKSEINTSIKKTDLKTLDYKINDLDVIENAYCKVRFSLVGGSDTETLTDTESDFYSDNESEPEFDESINMNNKLDKNEIEYEETDKSMIEILVSSIGNDKKYEKYSVNDYICLEDNITFDKILIGKIKKITDKSILVDDIKIPLINKNDDLVILYNVKTKHDFINELGSELLKLYINSDSSYLIYDKYKKNKYVSFFIDNINERLKEYPKQYDFTASAETTSLDEEALGQDIIEQILLLKDDEDTLIGTPTGISTSSAVNELDSTCEEKCVEFVKVITKIVRNNYKHIIRKYYDLYIQLLRDNNYTLVKDREHYKDISAKIEKNR